MSITPTSRFSQAVFALLAAALAAPQLTAAAARSVRVELRARAVVRGVHVTLADLLPAGTPASLEKRAAKIDLGAAPQPDAALEISRAQVQAALENQPQLLERLDIPAEVRIERFHRALSSREIASALNAEARRRGLKGGDPLRLNGMELTAPVTVTRSQPGLRVIAVRPDAMRHRTLFQLVARNEPDLVPFTVMVPRVVKFPGVKTEEARTLEMKSGSGTAEAAAQPRAASATIIAAKAVPFRRPKPKPILVEPGAVATLLVTGKGFTIKAIVIPLQEGFLGEQVRVRSLTTHRVLSAEVTGRNSLRSIL